MTRRLKNCSSLRPIVTLLSCQLLILEEQLKQEQQQVQYRCNTGAIQVNEKPKEKSHKGKHKQASQSSTQMIGSFEMIRRRTGKSKLDSSSSGGP